MGDIFVLTGNTSLSIEEQVRLAQIEENIKTHLKGMIEIGNLLDEIRDKRLYRQRYATFEDYCSSKWDMDKSYAYRLIGASAIVREMAASGRVRSNVLPTKERNVRELKRLPEQKRAEVWNSAVDAAGGSEPTHQQIKTAVQEQMPLTTRAIVNHPASPQHGQVVTIGKSKGEIVATVTDSGEKALFVKSDLKPLPDPIDLLRRLLTYPIEEMVPDDLLAECRLVAGIAT